jgi:putative phage-type endonuclease
MICPRLVQGSLAWHAWRLEGIGASEASAVLGLETAYMTRSELFNIKRGATKEAPGNFAMRRGTALEPAARREYERQTGVKAPAVLAIHPTRPHMRASLDGFPLDRVLEIKVAGKEDHLMAKAFRIPEKHKPQLQHQLAVTGAESGDYFSYNGQTGYIVPFEADKNYQMLLMEQVDEFWHLVQTNTPPELVDRDYENMRKSRDSETVALHLKWKATRSLVERAEMTLEQIYSSTSDGPFRRQPKSRGLRSKVSRKLKRAGGLVLAG